LEIKKYSIIFILIAVFGMLSSCSNSKRSDWNTFGVKGEVKSYIENYYDVEMKSGEWKKGDLITYGNSRVSFDRNGNYESIESFDEDNRVSEKVIPKRKDGEIIEEIQYNKNGKITGRSDVTSQSDTEFAYVSYDEDGKKISIGKIFLKNDKAERQELEMDWGGDANKKIIVEYKYDENGNISSLKQTDDKGEVMTHDVYKYTEFDDQNNWIERLEYSKDDSDKPSQLCIRVYEYY
jgi:hypothetical protein